MAGWKPRGDSHLSKLLVLAEQAGILRDPDCACRRMQALLASVIGRLSFNQITSKHATLQDCVEACVRHGVGWIAPGGIAFRKLVLSRARACCVIPACAYPPCVRGGFFPAATQTERIERIDDNRLAIDEAAELGAPCVVLVCGPAPDRD